MIVNPEVVAQHGVLSNYLPENIQPNSLDLRVDRVYRIEGGIRLYRDGSRVLPDYTEVSLNREGFFELYPESLYQIEFMEDVSFNIEVQGKSLCGLTFLRSSMFKSGASGETGLFDTGYAGGTGMTISVKHICYIEKGAAVAQMVFLHADPSHLYNGFYSSNPLGDLVRVRGTE